MANNEQQAELQVNNEQVTDFITNTSNQMRSAERILNTAIFILQGIAIENENEKEERDNVIAFLSGAMALVTQTKEITDEYIETALFKDE